MKKYFLGLTAVVIALTFCAFKAPKPQFSQTFSFDEAVYDETIEGNIEDLSKWEAQDLGCTGGTRVACVLENVSATYYHLEGGSDLILNTPDYISGTHEPGDAAMSIDAVIGSSSAYKVNTASSGTIKNKN